MTALSKTVKKAKTTQYCRVELARVFFKDRGRRTYGKPLSVIGFADAEQCLQRIIPWNHEYSNICQKLTPDVKENEKKISGDQSEKGVDLGDRGLLLQVVQSRILGKLGRKIQLADDS